MFTISKGLINSKDNFLMLAPSPFKLFKFKWLKYVFISQTIIKEIQNVKKGIKIDETIGKTLGKRIVNTIIFRHVRYGVSRSFLVSKHYRFNLNFVGLGASRRTWITSDDKGRDGRIVKKLTVVYHEANRAGAHIDVHLGHLSLVYRVTGKPVEQLLKFNSKGYLTENSKKALLDHVRHEVSKNARVPWNHDHTRANAKVSWAYSPELREAKGYGSGPTRQVILEDKVEFYHPEVKSSLHMYAPSINSNQGLYIYKIYSGNGFAAPILIWGNLIPRDIKFQDRLHLKMIQEKDYDRFIEKSDIRTTTRKYDGASCYFTGTGDMQKAHSFKFFSPRFSKLTGHRIEYTYKVSEMCDRGIPHQSAGMGELLFWKRTMFGNIAAFIGIRRGSEQLCWKYLSAAEIGGILNSNKVRERNIFPEFRLYRVDEWDGKDTFNFKFFENRLLQKQIIKESKIDNWKTVKLIKPHINKSWEGLVAVPQGKSINDGIKIKWWANADDWSVESIDLKFSEKGNIAGVVWFNSLESGKTFKLGPGNIGSVDRCLEMIDNPDSFIGKVYKVHSRNGHEGRAAKIVTEHLDK